MKVFTNDNLRAIDAATIERGDATSLQLVEHVAERVTAEITSRWKPTKPIAVFAGSGNNGADALATARMLAEAGYSPRVYLFNIGGNRLSEECRLERDMLRQTCPDVPMAEIIKQLVLPDLTRQWLVIDGLFGSGLRDSLTGGFQELVRKINDSGATVVSIDVPSGLHGDWNPNVVNRNVVHADLTLAVGFPRIAFFVPDNAPLVGEWEVIDLPLNVEAIRSTPTDYYCVTRDGIRSLFPPRNQFSSKADFGSTLIVAGSYGMFGAAVLAARAASRSGVGKVTVDAPASAMSVLQTAVPEAMFVADKDEKKITSIHLAHKYSSVAVGPGIGTDADTVRALEYFIKQYNGPLLLDADALNCIADNPSFLEFIPKNTIITPHAGEFDRLFGQQPNSEARLLKAIEEARRYSIVIVLKGRYTATIRPDGKVYFNTSGTPALATAGSGDVLTGLIAGFLARGWRPEVAAVAGVYVHGIAGELAEIQQGQYATTAADVAERIGKALIEISK